MPDDQVPGKRGIYRTILRVLVFLFALLMLAWWLLPGLFAKAEAESRKADAASPP
ncbi:MAG: hypothetical protein H0W72_18090 [Planctomycetes bacterium]|nr:hypothetical protein [Planctomycetota bacterium]